MPTDADDPSQGGWSDPGAPDGDDTGDDTEVAVITPGPRYVVGAFLGRGGMGAVHAARDLTLGRDVALKELPPHLAGDPGAQARLAREAAVTSRLDHPGIVSVHDAGRLPDGRPFYTMRLVRGRTLGRAAAEATTPEARRALVRHVLAAAEAVAAAHDAGLVHRDLKPANVLIGPHGETQVVDWGLAAPTPAAEPRWGDLPGRPARGVVGTTAYMAPEQARGDPPDPRHDVWSLGVVLAEVAGGPEADLPPELAAVVARATAAEPDHRYPDAAALADDLLRWFDGRRVSAYAYSPTDLLRRTLAAYRLPIAVGAAGLLALAVAVGVGWWQTARSLERAEAAEASAEAALAELQLDQAVRATRAGDRETAERLALAVLRNREDPLARGVFAAFGRAGRPAVVADDEGPDCAWSALPAGGAWVLCGHARSVSRWSNGHTLWTAEVAAAGGEVHAGAVVLWDLAGTTTVLAADDGRLLGRWPIPADGWSPQVPPRAIWAGDGPLAGTTLAPSGCPHHLRAVARSPTGRLAGLCEDGTLVLAGPDGSPALRVPTEVRDDHVAASLAWTPDGRLVAGTLRGRIHLFAGDSGAPLAMAETELGAIGTLRVSPDGRHVALGGTAGGVGLWRLDTAGLVAELPAGRPRAFAFGEDGLVVHDGRLRRWRLPGGAPAVIRATTGLGTVAASADGARLAAAGGGGFAVVVDLRDGRSHRADLGDRVVKAVAFGPGGLLGSAMAEPFLAVHDPRDGWRALAEPHRLRRLAWLDDGSIVGAELQRGLLRWRDPRTPPAAIASERAFIDLERDGEAVVVLDAEGRVEHLRGDTLTHLATEPGARGAALRGRLLAIATPGAVRLRGPGADRHLEARGAGLMDVALSPDGTRVAAGGLDGLVRVWDTATGALIGLLPGHRERVAAVEFLPDGDLVSVSWDRTARIWSLAALDRPVDALAAEVAAWGTAHP